MVSIYDLNHLEHGKNAAFTGDLSHVYQGQVAAFFDDNLFKRSLDDWPARQWRIWL